MKEPKNKYININRNILGWYRCIDGSALSRILINNLSFASSILAFPATIAGVFPAGSWGSAVVDQLSFGMPLYNWTQNLPKYMIC